MGMFQAKGFRWWRNDSHAPMPADLQAATPPVHSNILSADSPVWVIYASETGVAEDFADDACRRLKKIGRSSRLLPLDALDALTLASANHVLFLASTCDDGEPPTMAESFHRQYMHHSALLPNLHYGLLALGDRRYDDFCAFGRQLDQWLRSSGAHPLFDPVMMDNEDAAAVHEWHEGIKAMSERVDITSGADA